MENFSELISSLNLDESVKSMLHKMAARISELETAISEKDKKISEQSLLIKRQSDEKIEECNVEDQNRHSVEKHRG